MKDLLAMAISSLCLVPIAVQAQNAQQPPLSIEVSGGFFSDYMFRGFNLYDGTVFQPCVTTNYDLGDLGGMNSHVWLSFVTESDKEENNFTEVDYLISWSKQFGDLSVSVGHVWYTFPHDKIDFLPTTQEVFATVVWDTTLSPTLSIYHDYDDLRAQYYELGISYTIENLSKNWPIITPHLAVGFASNADQIYSDNGLVQSTLGISFDFSLGDITVTPEVNYTLGIDAYTVDTLWVGFSIRYPLGTSGYVTQHLT